ncbi:MAG: HD-GYP domain-containing protein, partial [Nitriliruptorales bacterium]|nr:HD-GYP domain-containing protein [Nitriliruptorales bacterium]
RHDVSASLDNVFILTALLIGGPELAVASTAALGLVVAIRNRRRWLVRALVNTGQFALSAYAGAMVFGWLGGIPGDLSTIISAEGLGRTLAAALALTTVNYLCVAAAIALDRHERVTDTFASMMAQTASLQVVYVGLSVVAAALIEIDPVALVLLLVPLLVARYGLLGFQEQAEAYDRMVRAFVKAIEVKDGYTKGHAERVAELSELVAVELGRPYDDQVMARYGALLHDVGKIGVPLCVINKRGVLDDEEFAQIQTHPTVGAEMLRDIEFLEGAVEIIRAHHERLDGRGYPNGLSGDQLNLLTRIVTAVDAFDAMTSSRSYRQAMPVEEALTELRRCTGTQFDPKVVEALERVVGEVGWEPTYAPAGLVPVPAAAWAAT